MDSATAGSMYGFKNPVTARSRDDMRICRFKMLDGKTQAQQQLRLAELEAEGARMKDQPKEEEEEPLSGMFAAMAHLDALLAAKKPAVAGDAVATEVVGEAEGAPEPVDAQAESEASPRLEMISAEAGAAESEASPRLEMISAEGLPEPVGAEALGLNNVLSRKLVAESFEPYGEEEREEEQLPQDGFALFVQDRGRVRMGQDGPRQLVELLEGASAFLKAFGCCGRREQ
eukprot:s1826_g2.t3